MRRPLGRAGDENTRRGLKLIRIVQAAGLDCRERHTRQDAHDRRPAVGAERAADLITAVARHLVVLELSLGQLERFLGNQQDRRERAAGRSLAIATVTACLHDCVGGGLVANRAAHASANNFCCHHVPPVHCYASARRSNCSLGASISISAARSFSADRFSSALPARFSSSFGSLLTRYK